MNKHARTALTLVWGFLGWLSYMGGGIILWIIVMTAFGGPSAEYTEW